MVDILLSASAKLGLALTRRDLMETPPIRDWIWFKNNEPLVTVGDAKPRYRPEQEKPADQALPSDEAPRRRRFLGLFVHNLRRRYGLRCLKNLLTGQTRDFWLLHRHVIG